MSDEPDDATLLAAYYAAIERKAALLKMLGCDDPAKATPEQIDIAFKFAMARTKLLDGDAEATIPVGDIPHYRRKLIRLKRKQES